MRQVLGHHQPDVLEGTFSLVSINHSSTYSSLHWLNDDDGDDGGGGADDDDNSNAAVTCEIKLFQNDFSLRRRPSEIILFQCVEACPTLFQNYFTGLLQLVNVFQHVHCRGNNFEIILELQRLK